MRPRRDGRSGGACGTSTARAAARGEVEVEVRVAARRPRGSCEDDAEHVDRCGAFGERAEVEQLRGRARRVPGADERRRLRGIAAVGLERRGLLVGPQEVAADRVEVVPAGLDAHQQAVEAGDVDADRVPPRLERLHEGRPRAGERVEHRPTRLDVAIEERLDELRDELAEVRVQAMDVLRPLPLRQLLLGPGERHVQAPVERLLRGRHRHLFGANAGVPRFEVALTSPHGGWTLGPQPDSGGVSRPTSTQRSPRPSVRCSKGSSRSSSSRAADRQQREMREDYLSHIDFPHRGARARGGLRPGAGGASARGVAGRRRGWWASIRRPSSSRRAASSRTTSRT